MNFEVDSDELRFAEVKMNKSSQNMKTIIEKWKNEIENLKRIWQGHDADVFFSKMDAYIEKLNMVSETTQMFSTAFKSGYTMYENTDEEFSKELKKENSQYDDEEYIRSKME